MFGKRGKNILIQNKTVLREKDGKCSKFFFKKVFDGKMDMVSVIDEDGKEVGGNEKVKKEAWKFYSKLYAERRGDEQVEDDVLDEI